MRWQPDFGWQEDVEFTDLVWSPRKDGVHFICEEVPKADAIAVRGSRYYHGVYIPDSHSFVHCDGAMRLYSTQEVELRHSSHVRNMGKIDKRVKVFQVEGEFPAEEWTSLACAFFIWNNDIEKYFGASDT